MFTADGSYPTGDLGMLDGDGYLWYSGRLDDMVKVKGATVYPSEVEAALRSVAGVAQAFVTDVSDAGGRPEIAALVDHRSTARRRTRRGEGAAERVQGADPLAADGRPRRRAPDGVGQGRQGRAAAAPGRRGKRGRRRDADAARCHMPERARAREMEPHVTKAIDCLVNVDFADQKQPEWMVRVKEDYFKGGDSFFKSPELPELLEDMDANGVERAILMTGQWQGGPGAALRRGRTRPVQAGRGWIQPVAPDEDRPRPRVLRARSPRGLRNGGAELLGRRDVPADRPRLLTRCTRSAASWTCPCA